MNFFGKLSEFEITLGFVQVLVLLVLVITVSLTWVNLRLIRNRMRLETRPILRVDLQDYQSATPLQQDTALVNDHLEEWRSQNPETTYRCVQVVFSNRQANPAGASLNAEILLELTFPTVAGQVLNFTVHHRLPILEAQERDGPLWVAEVGALPWCRASVRCARYLDVDGNPYQRTYGTIDLKLQQGQPAVHRYGQLGE